MLSKVSLLLLCGLLALCASVRATAGAAPPLPTIEQVVAQQHLQHQASDDHHEHLMQGDAPAPHAQARSASDALKDLRCYQCNSMDDAGCESNNTLKEKYLKPCATKNGQTAVGCWKLFQKVEYDQEKTLPAHSRVVRQCAYLFQEHSCANRAGFGGAVNQCFCNTTRCNHSAGLAASLGLLIASFFIAGKFLLSQGGGLGW